MRIKMISLLCLFLYLLSLSAAANNPFLDCLSTTIKTDISKIIYTPQSPNFTSTLQFYIRNSRFNISTTPKPTIIIAPTTAAEVSAAVVCAKNTKTLLKIRSGGHDYEGLSYIADSPFAILDMFNFRSISVDVPSKSAWVGSGALLGELYYQISQKSKTLAFPAGVCPTVGVGGHLSGAGYGNMLRRHGLTVDHITDAQIVTSNGAVLDRKSMGEDLFWAIRGGGAASFAVVLSYKINLVTVPEKVTYFRIEQFMSENAANTVYQYQQIVPETMDPDLFVRVLVQPQTKNKTTTIRTTFIGLFLGDAKRLLKITDSVFPTLKLNATGCQEMSWIDSILTWANFDINTTSPEVLLDRTSEVKFGKRKSDYVSSAISVDGMTAIFNKMIEVGKVGLVFNSYGGVMRNISENATPFPHRGNIFKIQYSVSWDKDEDTADRLGRANKLYEFMTPYVTKNPREAYLNYRDVDIGTNKNGKYDYGVKYFKKNFERLVMIKTAVDPDNFFRNEQSIPTKSLLVGH